jgi:hypothetical protein
MFYAPFGCVWRNSFSWEFGTDKQLAGIKSLDRLGKNAYLTINRKSFNTTPVSYNISDIYSYPNGT